jgi:hypothetical protein
MGDSPRSIKNLLWVIVVMALTSPLFFVFDQIGKPGTGRAAWICAGMFLVAIKVRWELRNRLWFWSTIVALLALHIPLILYLPWTSRWIPAVGIFALGVVDCAIILGCIALIEKRMKNVPIPDQ